MRCSSLDKFTRHLTRARVDLFHWLISLKSYEQRAEERVICVTFESCLEFPFYHGSDDMDVGKGD